MSLTFIVDGYNAMERSGIFKRKSFMDGRAAFVSYLDHHGLKGSERNRLVVVFDGKEDVFAPRMDCSFEVIFTKGESADDKIKEMVAHSSEPKNIVVVTDDKGIISVVRRYGVGIKSTTEFLNKKKGRRMLARNGAVSGSEHKIDLNIVQRDAITEELKGIWLREKKSF